MFQQCWMSQLLPGKSLWFGWTSDQTNFFLLPCQNQNIQHGLSSLFPSNQFYYTILSNKKGEKNITLYIEENSFRLQASRRSVTCWHTSYCMCTCCVVVFSLIQEEVRQRLKIILNIKLKKYLLHVFRTKTKFFKFWSNQIFKIISSRYFLAFCIMCEHKKDVYFYFLFLLIRNLLHFPTIHLPCLVNWYAIFLNLN